MNRRAAESGPRTLDAMKHPRTLSALRTAALAGVLAVAVADVSPAAEAGRSNYVWASVRGGTHGRKHYLRIAFEARRPGSSDVVERGRWSYRCKPRVSDSEHAPSYGAAGA